MKIPFNKILQNESDFEYIQDALNKDSLSGDGYYTKLVIELLKSKFNANQVCMTTSATHSLEMACSLIDLKTEDEVIMPSFSFPSTANAVMLKGATPVFAEVDAINLNIDPYDVEKRITKNTKAIIPVHYAGIACDMDKILEIANKYNIYIIEDAAQGINSKYKKQYLGTIGHFGCYSFHATKNVTCGEGGALTINIQNDKIYEKAQILRQKGTNRYAYDNGVVDKYSWVGIGSSYSPSDILMALLYSQLNKLDEITKNRKRIFDNYLYQLKYFKSDIIKNVVTIPDFCEPNYHLFYILVDSKKSRDIIIKKMKEKGVETTFHFSPLHSSKMGEKLGYKLTDLEKTQNLSESIIRLPLYPQMSNRDIDYVITTLKNIVGEL